MFPSPYVGWVNTRKHTQRNTAFSLVELSIVLVILGLLVGGILAGQSLIRASELRSVTTQYQSYATAGMAFRDRYFQLPGDFSSAAQVWGTMATGTCPNASAGTGTQTCSGDGDGVIEVAAAPARTGENFTFFQHLANAGLIEGSYSGIAGAAGFSDSQPGVNVPQAKLSNAAWYLHYESATGTSSGSSFMFDGTDLNNSLIFGAVRAGLPPNADIIKPVEAWGIDKKVDDGMPGAGKVIARNRRTCALASDGSALTTSAADAAKLDAIYDLANTANNCALFFKRAF